MRTHLLIDIFFLQQGERRTAEQQDELLDEFMHTKEQIERYCKFNQALMQTIPGNLYRTSQQADREQQPFGKCLKESVSNQSGAVRRDSGISGQLKQMG